ncbi:hypothetical protein Tco_0945103, partial [Tanacetum coccineum]
KQNAPYVVVTGDGEVAAVEWQPRWCGCDVGWEMVTRWQPRGWRGDDVNVVAMIVVRCSDGLNGGSGGVVSWRCGGRRAAGSGRSWQEKWEEREKMYVWRLG